LYGLELNTEITTLPSGSHYVIVDIETTGGSPRASKITEIAIYKHDGEKIIDSYETLLNPEMEIPRFITNLTGISDKMVENAPKFYEVAKQIVEFTEGCIFVAHNVGFDYGIIRQEFKNLGFDYRRPHMCTVRASRYVIPGHESYSLGKLTRALGIQIENRHRAGGDALATAHLFTILNSRDSNSLKTFIQQDINPAILHPNLDVDFIDELPSKTGVYKFFDDTNQLIYIGKSINIKKRVEQHLRNASTRKGIEMREAISRIEFELTGSELIALLLESMLIKKYTPRYNQALKKSKFPYGLFSYQDETGYIRLYLGLTSKTKEMPLTSFGNKREGVNFLERWTEEKELCQKLTDLYPTKSSCFHYEIKKCKGACIGQEPTEDYNGRVNSLIGKLNFEGESFYLLENGRAKNEKSLVLVENGAIIGFGYAPYFIQKQEPYRWKRYIDLYQEDRDAKTILTGYIRKGKKIFRIDI
jgi:DNA polymerase III subunit epsilon